MSKRPYSTKYTARSNPRRYLLDGIPPTLWEEARAKAKREGLSMRTLILTLIEQWVAEGVAGSKRDPADELKFLSRVRGHVEALQEEIKTRAK